ncbi:lysozyme inhibitor LprI family protein [Pasteurella multocida]|uniref:lysozyme inhibitor LprI family protein n=1 Tax=Pasteurella multocida TaxID=747 RepID=UPI0035A90C00
MKLRHFLFSTICLVSLSAMASNACSHFTTSYDRTYCSAKLFLESDKELNDVYKELKKQVKPTTSQSLVQTQREWLKYRNSACEKDGTINVDCNYEVNKERTEYLRNRLRECKTGNCRDSDITRRAWEN